MSVEGLVATSSTHAVPQTKRVAASFMNKLRSKLSSLSFKQSEKKRDPTNALSWSSATRLYCPQTDKFDRVFNYFDENGDGKISPYELHTCLLKMFGEDRLSLEEAEAAVQSADSDGDGLLGFDDFVALVDAQEEEEQGRGLKEAFEVYVMEGKGYITAKSLRRVLRLLGVSKSVEECEAMIREFDVNGDGVICFEEFKTMML